MKETDFWLPHNRHVVISRCLINERAPSDARATATLLQSDGYFADSEAAILLLKTDLESCLPEDTNIYSEETADTYDTPQNESVQIMWRPTEWIYTCRVSEKSYFILPRKWVRRAQCGIVLLRFPLGLSPPIRYNFSQQFMQTYHIYQAYMYVHIFVYILYYFIWFSASFNIY